VPANVEPVFEDVSSQLDHVHHDEPFDDFARQPLLPRRLSQLGPGVCWWDLDGDGREDLLIGTGKGGRMACYRNKGNGSFEKFTPTWDVPAPRDQTAIVGWDSRAVLAGAANYEDGQTNGAAVESLKAGEPRPLSWVEADQSSVGPLAVGDYDGDGALDLFVGGRVKPGKYPEAASSRLFHGRGGKLVLDEANTARLKDVGLVSGAVWSDLDGDGYPELILACEWGPIRVFHNDHGNLTESTEALGLSRFVGWWNGVTTGDLDGDGRPEIIASNWGRNTQYEHFHQRPLRLYYTDPAQEGPLQLIEAGFEPASNKYHALRRLDIISSALPFLAARFRTHQAWAQAGIEEICAALPQPPRRCEAGWLDSTVFVARGSRFEPRPLPMEAQLAPAFAVCVADYDGDGSEDVFLSQNFFDVEPETSRYDAGRGLWLKGDGRGGFRAVPGQESGVRAYGEQRGAATCDYDADGRIDLVVAQNNDQTKLFHNRLGRPGLRVRLDGPEGNRFGIGASVRLRFKERFGPARENHGGSGYWSQDSPVMVLATPEEPLQVQVRWPGGHTTLAEVPSGAREINVSYRDSVRKIR